MNDPHFQPTVAGPDAPVRKETLVGDSATTLESSRPHSPFPDVPGFTIVKEIGAGGMGVVYLANDLAINREVAVKLLQDKFAADARSAERFMEEARITGQLQHPGIPAVYQIGTLPGGGPYLAMKLIKGKTLDEMQENPTGEHPNWLAVFEAICQAVGYAHAHAVIHRDLKPSNVMVGSFGEVQVMDWGLAKVLRPNQSPERERRDETPPSATLINAVRDSDTRPGSIMGTPAYMSPEQAGGDTERIDQRSDVFSLGAILCVILTGKPPYTGKSVDSILRDAIRGNVGEAFARLDASGVEPEVIALAKRCLAFEPAERFVDASVLAQEVASIRANAERRARAAEMQRAQAEVRAAEQLKRRRVLQIAGGTLAAILVAGIIGTTWGLLQARESERLAKIEQQRADEEARRAREQEAEAKKQEVIAKINALEADKQTGIANDKTAEALKQEGIATTNAKEAAEQRNLSLATIRSVIYDINGRLKDAPGQQQLRADLLNKAKEGLQKIARNAENSASVDHEQIWVFFLLGDIFLELGANGTAEAGKMYRVAHELAEKLAKDDPRSAQGQRDLSVSLDNVGKVQLQNGEGAAALASYQRSLEISEKLAKDDPRSAQGQRDLAVSRFKFGDLHQRAGDFGKAADQFARGRDTLKSFAKPEFFKNEIGLLEGRLQFCRLAEKAMDDPKAGAKEPSVLAACVLALAKQKKPEKVIQTADLLVECAKDGGDSYIAACGYALCIPLVDKKETQEQYGKRAVELLRKAAEMGFRDVAHIKKNSDLEPLRQRDDFKQFLAELEKLPPVKK